MARLSVQFSSQTRWYSAELITIYIARLSVQFSSQTKWYSAELITIYMARLSVQFSSQTRWYSAELITTYMARLSVHFSSQTRWYRAERITIYMARLSVHFSSQTRWYKGELQQTSQTKPLCSSTDHGIGWHLVVEQIGAVDVWSGCRSRLRGWSLTKLSHQGHVLHTARTSELLLNLFTRQNKTKTKKPFLMKYTYQRCTSNSV